MMYVWGVRGWRKLYYLGFDLEPDRNRIWVILTLVSIFRAFSLSSRILFHNKLTQGSPAQGAH